MSKLFAVLGDPIAHSKSPAMHGAAYRALGLPHRYEAIRATREDLPKLVEALRAGTYAGFNVTVPHKAHVLAYAEVIEASAEAVSAANTIAFENGRVVALNTDVPAIAEELRALAPERSQGDWAVREALVLGSGGAARAALAALASIGVTRACVRARGAEGETARALAKAAGANVTLRYESLTPQESRSDAGFHVVVQATSLGMLGGAPGTVAASAITWPAAAPDLVVFDAIYNPPETELLRAARAHGLRAQNGLGMLVTQGALAFERWLGIAPPRDVMLAALH